MADANSTVERLQSFDPQRRDVAIKAADKIQVLLDALITYAVYANECEDIHSATAIVQAVAVRGSRLAGALRRTLNPTETQTYSTEDLRDEVHNG